MVDPTFAQQFDIDKSCCRLCACYIDNDMDNVQVELCQSRPGVPQARAIVQFVATVLIS
jgi:hypothetical protein